MRCTAIYRGNSFPHFHGARCDKLVHSASEAHHSSDAKDLLWHTKTPEQRVRELKDDSYRAPEVKAFPARLDVETAHFLALQEDARRGKP